MIALIDYDAGNIKSVEKAFQSLGKEVVLTRDPEVLKRADHVVLPGVGSFGDAMENLNRYHLVPVIHEIVEKGTPFLGICLGLQILFERSEESPGVEGLGLLKGEILRIPDKEGLKIPHMGCCHWGHLCCSFANSTLHSNIQFSKIQILKVIKLYKNTEILKISFTPALFFLFILDKWRASRYNKSVALRNDNIL